MSGPQNNHRQPEMDQDYLVEGIFVPIKVASKLSLETVIKMGALDAFVPVGPNRYKVSARRSDKPELIVDAEGSIWMRSGNRDMFIRVAADEPPSPDEKEDRKAAADEDEDDLSAGFGEEGDEAEDKYPHRSEEAGGADDQTGTEFADGQDLPTEEIPDTADNPTREVNNEPVPPPQANQLDMSAIGPTHQNETLIFQTYSPGKTPKPTLQERVQEHKEGGEELRNELSELVSDVSDVLELAAGTIGPEPAEEGDELTVVLSTPQYVNPLIPAVQTNDPSSPTFAAYGSQKQANDDEGPEDYPPDSEQGARDAARHAFATTVSVSGDTDAAHDAAYEAAFQALTPFIQDIGQVEQLAQAIVSDMQTAPKIGGAIYDLDSPTCPTCGMQMTAEDKRTYEANGGKGWPRICDDCAESPLEDWDLQEQHGLNPQYPEGHPKKLSALPPKRGPHGEQMVTNPALLEEGIGKPFKHYRPSEEESNPRGWGSLPSSDPEVAKAEWGSLPSYDQDKPKQSVRKTADEENPFEDDEPVEETVVEESEPTAHVDADLNDSEKLDLILREIEEVEEAVGINESPEVEAAEEDEVREGAEAESEG